MCTSRAPVVNCSCRGNQILSVSSLKNSERKGKGNSWKPEDWEDRQTWKKRETVTTCRQEQRTTKGSTRGWSVGHRLNPRSGEGHTDETVYVPRNDFPRRSNVCFLDPDKVNPSNRTSESSFTMTVFCRPSLMFTPNKTLQHCLSLVTMVTAVPVVKL